MLLFFQDSSTTSDEFSSGGIKVELPTVSDAGKVELKGIAKSIEDALATGLDPTKQFQKLTVIEEKAKDLQKTIGSGWMLGGDQFREKLEQIYFNTEEVGVQFKDVTDLVGGLAKGVGLIIDPSSKVTENMVLLANNIGLAREAMGGLIADFMKLTFSQEKSADLIKTITDRARAAGVNANTTLTSIQKNLSKVDAYGFKNGVDGLTKMTIQAQQLKTTVEDIGAVQMGQTFWDPEKAIETAAGMSMLGGSMSDLMNPFQLMNMGANDVEKLQEKLIDLSASAFKVDEATGKVETNFIAQQRLRQQLSALGKEGEYEKFVNMGREAAKQAQIIEQLNKSGLGSLFEAEGGAFTEEDQRLIASLSEVGKDGKISLNIPGQEGIADLKDALRNPAGIKEALTEYQSKAAMSERDIAEKSLSSVDQINNSVKMIEQTLLRNISGSERTKLLTTATTPIISTVKETQTLADTGVTAAKQMALDPTFWEKFIPKPEYRPPTPDGFFGDGKKKLITGKGEMFNFIEDDQALFAPDLDEKLGVLKSSYLKLNEVRNSENLNMNPNQSKLKETTFKNPFESISTTSKVETKTEKTVVQKVEGSGTININVNITSNGNLANTLMSDRSFKNQLESEILSTIKNKDILMVKKP